MSRGNSLATTSRHGGIGEQEDSSSPCHHCRCPQPSLLRTPGVLTDTYVDPSYWSCLQSTLLSPLGARATAATAHPRIEAIPPEPAPPYIISRQCPCAHSQVKVFPCGSQSIKSGRSNCSFKCTGSKARLQDT